MLKKQYKNNIQSYYNNNTKRFLRRGEVKNSGHIHQALWPKGIQRKEVAIVYSNQLLLERIQKQKAERILDLGCGVGASLLYLSQHLPNTANLSGLTISSEQVKIAQALRRDQAPNATIQIWEGDFQKLPTSLYPIDFAYAIEAFVHSPDAHQFFESLNTIVPAGGNLVLIDDFLSTPQHRHRNWVKRFEKGWVLGSLLAVAEVQSIAEEKGWKLVEDNDLSLYLRLFRPRDIALSILHPILWLLQQYSTYILALEGGNARNKCLRKKWIHYRLLRFERI